MRAAYACRLLGLSPGRLAAILRREVAYCHLELAGQAESPEGPELGGFGLEDIANLLRLIGELDAAHHEVFDRAAQEDEGGGGAKEATLAVHRRAATPTPPHRTAPEAQQ